ncbi:AI-2E family transporter [Aurantibacter sp.]|uniref:AI-2E family transporter n=1 Tax=Aurantibacter sp. TaxID=2807103 RepID=UPI0035C800EE
MDNLRTTNKLLLALVIPVIFYLLKLLSFIFIPLVSSMFIALLFLPLMRFLQKKGLSKLLSIGVVIIIFGIGLKLGIELVKLSSQQIMASDSQFFSKAETQINNLITTYGGDLGIESNSESSSLTRFINKEGLSAKLAPTFSFISRFLTALLMTVFFAILWLADSINIQKLLNNTILKKKHTSIKTFMKIERDLIKFIKVKVLVSALTGIFTGLACYFFNVSFPIFWGLFAFLINFVQMVGSFIAVIACSVFALVELEISSTLVFFIITVSMVQVVFGAILEPVFMGKSFSINIITVLVMLMFWGYIWGIPGLIMAIPITVFFKIILEQFPTTKVLASLLSADDK